MNLSAYRENADKQRQGSPIYVGDAVFYVRRWGTEEALTERRELEKVLFGPFHKYRESDNNALVAHWLSEYGITDWEWVSDDDGETLPFSRATARRIFLNPEYHLSLNQILFLAANNFENYLHDEAEEDLAETKKSSSGTSTPMAKKRKHSRSIGN